MASGLKIAEVARRTGFTATALRYYEDIGLVVPSERTPAGYRLYDEAAVERLAFVARAKQLGCSLDEIAVLVRAWDDGNCAPVQQHLRTLLETKIDEAQSQSAGLLALATLLRRARDGLDLHTPEGSCDDTCGCTTDALELVPLALTVGSRRVAPMACTLDREQLPDRVAEWHAALVCVLTRESIAGGVRLGLVAGAALDEIARLAAVEHDCCRFLSFAITVDERGAALEVRAPADAAPMVEAIFGSSVATPVKR